MYGLKGKSRSAYKIAMVRDGEIDPFMSVALRLPIKRHMLAILLEGDHRQKDWALQSRGE